MSFNMTSKVLKHINAEPYGYRTPVFVIGRDGDKTSINLRKCDFNTSFNNISFNNNTIRWLRRVNTSINSYVLQYYPSGISVLNPYIVSKNKPYAEWHLCELKIPPGIYM